MDLQNQVCNLQIRPENEYEFKRPSLKKDTNELHNYFRLWFEIGSGIGELSRTPPPKMLETGHMTGISRPLIVTTGLSVYLLVFHPFFMTIL